MKPEIALKPVRFGMFSFDLASGELRCGKTIVPLRPRAAEALKILVVKAGRVVSHDELRHALWGATVLEWQDGLHQVIRDVRKALGDDARRPDFIETVARRGYRFRATLESHGAEARAVGVNRRLPVRDALVFGGGVLAVPGLILVMCLVVGILG